MNFVDVVLTTTGSYLSGPVLSVLAGPCIGPAREIRRGPACRPGCPASGLTAGVCNMCGAVLWECRGLQFEIPGPSQPL